MKTRYLFLLLFITIIYTACQKEDGDNANNNSSNNTTSLITGEWYATSFTEEERSGYYENYPNDKVNLEVNISNWPCTNGDGCDIISLNWNFKQNGLLIATYVYSDASIYVDTTTYIKQGSTLTIDGSNLGDLFGDTLIDLSINTLNNSTSSLNYYESDTLETEPNPNNPNQNVVLFGEVDINYNWERN